MKWKISPLNSSFDKSHFDCGYIQLNSDLAPDSKPALKSISRLIINVK